MVKNPTTNEHIVQINTYSAAGTVALLQKIFINFKNNAPRTAGSESSIEYLNVSCLLKPSILNADAVIPNRLTPGNIDITCAHPTNSHSFKDGRSALTALKNLSQKYKTTEKISMQEIKMTDDLA